MLCNGFPLFEVLTITASNTLEVSKVQSRINNNQENTKCLVLTYTTKKNRRKCNKQEVCIGESNKRNRTLLAIMRAR